MTSVTTSNCTVIADSSSYEVDKLYVILAVATATLSFFLNFTQFMVIIHQGLLRRNKNIVIINLCVCGQLSSLTVVWYIYEAIAFWQEGRVVDDYMLCFLLPSGLHLLTIFTFTPLITLLVLQHHLVTRPRNFRRFHSNHLVVVLLVVLAWCEAIIISLIPLTGWNNWRDVCSIPVTWSPSFSVLICVIYFLHYPMVIILLTDLCLYASKRWRSVCPNANNDSGLRSLKSDLYCLDEIQPMSLKSNVVLLLLYMAGTLPFVCYTGYVAVYQDTDLCQSLVANEKAAMWTSWVTVVFAAVRPLFHILVEDDVGDSTAYLMVAVLHWGKNENP